MTRNYEGKDEMVRPTSFRLPADLVARLDHEASAARTSLTGLVTEVLDEGLKTRQFPGVAYRDGPTGRRAGLVSGPDVWEVVRAVRAATGRGEQRVRRVAEERDLPIAAVRLAVDFYTAFPAEVDARITADDEAAASARTLIARRERLISS